MALGDPPIGYDNGTWRPPSESEFRIPTNFFGGYVPKELQNWAAAPKPGAGGMPAPQFDGQAQKMFNNIYKQGLGGNTRDFDTAANRLRERITTSARGQTQQAINQNLGSGFRGQMRSQLGAINQGRLAAEAEGLVQLQDSFENQRLQGLGIANQAAIGLGNQNIGEQSMIGDNNRWIQEDYSKRMNDFASFINQFLLGKAGIKAGVVEAAVGSAQ